MPLKWLQDYMAQCLAQGVPPTWGGLKHYQDDKKAQASARAENEKRRHSRSCDTLTAASDHEQHNYYTITPEFVKEETMK